MSENLFEKNFSELKGSEVHKILATVLEIMENAGYA